LFQGYITIVIMIAFERTVMRRQQWVRQFKNEATPVVTAFYPNTTHKDVDKSMKDCAKFMLNYCFFKYGVEVSVLLSIVC